MKTETQFSITIDDETLNKIKPLFTQVGKSKFKNTVYSLVMSVKLAMNFNRKNVYLKKQDDGTYLVSFRGTPELYPTEPRRIKNNKIIAETTTLTLTEEELKTMIAPYNIWLVNNKIKSTSRDALEQFYDIHVDNVFENFYE